MQLERFAVGFTLSFSLLALGVAGCDDETDAGGDAGPLSDGGAPADAGDAGAKGACQPSDCDGLPVSAIACADGPTTVVCERTAGGTCSPSVRCGPHVDGGPAPAVDAGPAADASSHADAGAAPDASASQNGGQGLGKTCGGIAGLACGAGLFCDYAVDAGGTGCTGISDASGVCVSKPDVCADLYDPVCSCSTRSYSSACEAHAKGAAVKHTGLCTSDECTATGGRAVYSNGASTPACSSGEVSFSIPGKEPAICCVAGP